MYIEFQIPKHTGVAAQHALWEIKTEIESWSQRYGISYTQKTIKWTHRLGFQKEEHFSLFSMTWQAGREDFPSWLNYQIVRIENERY